MTVFAQAFKSPYLPLLRIFSEEEFKIEQVYLRSLIGILRAGS